MFETTIGVNGAWLLTSVCENLVGAIEVIKNSATLYFYTNHKDKTQSKSSLEVSTIDVGINTLNVFARYVVYSYVYVCALYIARQYGLLINMDVTRTTGWFSAN